MTGSAGFIGTALVERLTADGYDVLGVDRRATDAIGHELLDLHEVDVRELFSGVDTVYHLAGQPGVQSSWGPGFATHVDDNIALGQRVLEAALGARVDRVVVASSSSVYGNVHGFARESDPIQPLSPYGVTKAALEQLVGVYAARGLDATVLRYFTVFGPGQRPDMAIARIIEAALGGPPFRMAGDGSQQRDFTFIGDIVAATAAAAAADIAPGTPINVGSGHPIALRRIIRDVGRLVEGRVPVVHAERPPGDPDRTAACIDRAARLLGWEPTTDLLDGLAAQVVERHAMATARAR